MRALATKSTESLALSSSSPRLSGLGRQRQRTVVVLGAAGAEWTVNVKEIVAVGTVVVAVVGAYFGLKADVAAGQAELKADVAELKADFKADVAALKADVAVGQAELKAGQTVLKADVAELKADLAELKTDFKAGRAMLDHVWASMANLKVRLPVPCLRR